MIKTVVLAWLGFSIQPLPFCLFEHSEVQISVIVSWFNFRLSDIASIWLTNFKSKPSSSGPLSTARQRTTLQTVHDYIILYIKYMTNYSKIYFEKHSMECKILIKMSISSMPMKFLHTLVLENLGIRNIASFYLAPVKCRKTFGQRDTFLQALCILANKISCKLKTTQLNNIAIRLEPLYIYHNAINWNIGPLTSECMRLFRLN